MRNLVILSAVALGLAGCGDAATEGSVEVDAPAEEQAVAEAIFDTFNEGKFVDDSVLGFSASFRNSLEGQQLELTYPGLVDSFLDRTTPIVRDYFAGQEAIVRERNVQAIQSSTDPAFRQAFLDFITSETGELLFGSMNVREELETANVQRPEDFATLGQMSAIRATRELDEEHQAVIEAFETQYIAQLQSMNMAQLQVMQQTNAEFLASEEFLEIQGTLQEMVEARAAR